MKVESITLRPLRVPLKNPFESNFRRTTHRETTLVTIRSEHLEGYAETLSYFGPFYTEETPGTVLSIQREYLIPLLLGKKNHPSE
ncbi:MAG: hypothetical protein ACK5LK_01105 [Chthoniobacterales bacterium]